LLVELLVPNYQMRIKYLSILDSSKPLIFFIILPYLMVM
jgi:hypothetical protein